MNGSSAQPRISVDRKALSRFCERWQVNRLEFFGSVLREDFGPASDIDVMVTFGPGHEFQTGFELVEMQWELEAMFGRKVDISTRVAVERSRNQLLKDYIFSGAADVIAR